MDCGKCSLPVVQSDGYIKCQGCQTRYHYPCSLKQSTWRSKSKKLQDEWRCRVKCKSADDPADNADNKDENAGELSDDIESILKALFQEFVQSNSTEISNLESNLKNHVNSVHEKTDKLIYALTSKIDEIYHTLKSVRASQKELIAENTKLKDEVTLACEKIGTLELKMQSTQLSATPTPSTYAHTLAHHSQLIPQSRSTGNITGSSNNNATVTVTKPPGNEARLPKSPVVHSPQSNSGTGSVAGHAKEPRLLTAPSGASVSSGTSGKSLTTVADWKRVTYQKRTRPRVEPKIGTKTVPTLNASSLPMVRANPPKTAALFVSRFCPTVTSQDIKNTVTNSVPNLSHLKVSKIKTKYQENYASFHVEVLSTDFPKIDEAGVWPDGCLIKPYEGYLRAHIVIPDVPTING